MRGPREARRRARRTMPAMTQRTGAIACAWYDGRPFPYPTGQLSPLSRLLSQDHATGTVTPADVISLTSACRASHSSAWQPARQLIVALATSEGALSSPV